MKFRLAKQSDFKNLAEIHLECGKVQPDGFMHQLGIYFLITYYKILLKEGRSVIVLAEDHKGFVHGFCSGTLAAEEHLMELKKNRLKLIISVIPALIKSPKLIFKLVARDKYVSSSENSIKFGVTSGSRCEYWAWRPQVKNLTMSMHLFDMWRKIIFDLGSDSIKGEVDFKNKYILKIHKILGANVISDMELLDGRKRVVIEYTNINK